MTTERPSISGGTGEYEAWNHVWSDLPAGKLVHYSSTAPRTYHGLWLRCYFDDVWQMLGRNRTAQCLEMGSGRGTVSMYLSAEGCAVTLLDLAPHAFKLAVDNFRQAGLPTPECVQADATNTGLPADSYDLIHSTGLLEHFDDPRPVLAESLRLLRPGGLAFHIVVPTVPERRKWLSYALFAPWKLPPRRLKDAVHALLGRDSKGKGETMTRTEFGVADYREWMAALPATDVLCVPYNSYHEPSSQRAVERWLAVPTYRGHHAVKRKLTRAPWTRTSSSLGMCVLVAFRKPRA